MFLNNHDFPRSVSRWGRDSRTHWFKSATMLQTFLLTMRGTPYFYYGEEIGMTNIKFDNITDYKDINTLNRYRTIKKQGGDTEAFLENEKNASRDNSRTPMQWDTTLHAGFSKEKPWLKVNDNYKEGINVATQTEDVYSVLNYFKRMVQIRKAHPTLVYGEYKLLQEDNECIYAYTRTLADQRFLVLLSFSTNRCSITLNELEFEKAKLLISNDDVRPRNQSTFELYAYQASVYELD